MKKLGVEKEFTAMDVKHVANIDAHVNFMLMLTGSRSYFNNILGSGGNLIIQEGFEPIRRARRLLKAIEEVGTTRYEDLPSSIKSEFSSRQDYDIYRSIQEELSTSDIMYNFTKFEGQLQNYMSEGEVYSFFRALREGKDAVKDFLSTKSNFKGNLGRSIVNIGSAYMRSSEYALRKTALAMGIIKGKELGLEGDALKSYAENYVYRTQFDYSNVDSPEFRRTTVGRMFSRFLIVNWRNNQLMSSIWREWNDLGRPVSFNAFISGNVDKNEEFRRFARMAIWGIMMSGLASIWPYSIFSSVTPQPFDAAKDFAEMIFNPDVDVRKNLQYGGYGTNLIASPLLQQSVLSAIYAALFSDFEYKYNTFIPKPFMQAYKLYSYPQYAVETITGIPLLTLKKTIRSIEEDDDQQE